MNGQDSSRFGSSNLDIENAGSGDSTSGQRFHLGAFEEAVQNCYCN